MVSDLLKQFQDLIQKNEGQTKVVELLEETTQVFRSLKKVVNYRLPHARQYTWNNYFRYLTPL